MKMQFHTSGGIGLHVYELVAEMGAVSISNGLACWDFDSIQFGAQIS